ncbi:Pectin lyase-like superfamily protein [Quillaja saponaria]|uniref:Pectin lyase-like superfamily protein n=1 Tax=Quillaja saponaria TaxID=32244 RepID=A0AAD7LFL4_QUISA|nr:Pectin lyase-like superfamily protein [Quillaja saponaria]
MQGVVSILLVVFLVASSSCSCARIPDGFNGVNAFQKAWRDVCGASGRAPTLNIPKGKTFMLQPVLFEGPCKSPTINFKVEGNIVAPKSIREWKWQDNEKGRWIRFSNIVGLVINGGGQIDGQGAAWWNDCKDNCVKPTGFQLHSCKNLQLSELTYLNNPKNHISINGCDGAQISKLRIIAPEDSPNTDGIDISESSNVRIENSFIGTGDDCIAINGGTSFINITNVFCGPGHGISIGSLGKDGTYETVEEIHVQNCTFRGTQNGVRIKTWQGGKGYARKITFEDITLEATKNPVIIDQYYNPNDNLDAEAMKVSDVTYRNVHGTSMTEKAINLNCDKTMACTNIVMDRISITSAVPGKNTFAFCFNAHGIVTNSVPNVAGMLQ